MDSWTSSAEGQYMPAGWATPPAAPACSVCSSPGGRRGDEASSPPKRRCLQPQERGPVPRPAPAALPAAAAAEEDDLPFFSEEELQLLEKCMLPGAAPPGPADAASAVGPTGSARDEGDDADSAARPCRAAAGVCSSVFVVAAHPVVGHSAAVAGTSPVQAPPSCYIAF